MCAGDGGWSATVTLTRTGTVFARFPGDGLHAAADSPRMTVTILPRLALRLSRAQVRRGRQVRASGTVTPPGARRAVLVVERREPGRWRRLERRRIPVVAGRYAATVRLARPGRHRITVSVPGATVSRSVRAT